ncbi:alpha-N-acetylglucosaminidase isoform X2 [Panulirus ornatus]|uniref:alpha-N-acetylglucosaminidase isoform X2 n=1 Tax=Panulirus ornatus TaxID=150431 RepID=UPI003A84A3C9
MVVASSPGSLKDTMGGVWKKGILQGTLTVPVLVTAVMMMMIGSVTGTSSGETPPWEQYFAQTVPDTSPEEQTQAVEGLLQRLLPQRSKEFSVRVDPALGPEGKDTFTVASPGVNTSVDIAGTSGVAAAWGILHYLKYSCYAHVSWEADQLDLPVTLPHAQFKVTSNDRFRYYQNVCTVSYSMVWWQWQRWQREIDWMALNGINAPLAFTGQEAIWQRLYTKMGLTQAELDEHFVGPAFQAWGRMGNIRGWGGPLSPSWHNQTLTLQHQILARMRQFGMTPVLPAFAGHVPAGLTRLYPEANVTRLEAWGHFTDPYTRTYLLDANDPLFQTIGSTFIQEMISEFGTNHMYNCDTFNEMTPTSSDPEYLKSIGASIYEAMKKVDPDAIWVMQGWLFFNDAAFWHKQQAQALLTSVPIGRMLVLDLASEVEPQYGRLESYFGQPFIFCMLHNYGGVSGLFGNVQVLMKNMKTARQFPNVTLVGTGITPEGINQNYVMYDFMSELAWRTQPVNVSQWAVDYARRRYGSADPRLGHAWQLLMQSVYNAKTKIFNHGQYNVVIRPEIDLKPDEIWYTVADVVRAWDLLVAIAKSEKDENTLDEDMQEGKENIHRPISLTRGINMDPSAPHKQHNMGIESDLMNMAEKVQQSPSRSKASTYSDKSYIRWERQQNSIKRFSHYLTDVVNEKAADRTSPTQKLNIKKLVLWLLGCETSMGRKNNERENETVRNRRYEGVGKFILAESREEARESEETEEHTAEDENKRERQEEIEIKQNSELREDMNESELGTTTRRYNRVDVVAEPLVVNMNENQEEQKTIEWDSIEGNIHVTEQATFHHDLVDVTRQMLQLVGGQMVMTLIKNYKNQVFLALQESHYLLQDLLKDLDLLLGSSPNFLLGLWVDEASTWATDQKERDQYVFNALNQITLWGPTGEIHDYAIKQWAGLIQNYIKPRWELFGQTLLTGLQQGTPFNQSLFHWNLFENVEDPFTKNTNASYPSVPQGDSIEIACHLYEKYRPVFGLRLLQTFQRQYYRTLKRIAMKKNKRKMKNMNKDHKVVP